MHELRDRCRLKKSFNLQHTTFTYPRQTRPMTPISFSAKGGKERCCIANPNIISSTSALRQFQTKKHASTIGLCAQQSLLPEEVVLQYNSKLFLLSHRLQSFNLHLSITPITIGVFDNRPLCAAKPSLREGLGGLNDHSAAALFSEILSSSDIHPPSDALP